VTPSTSSKESERVWKKENDYIRSPLNPARFEREIDHTIIDRLGEREREGEGGILTLNPKP
jgi:hypothetical protein